MNQSSILFGKRVVICEDEGVIVMALKRTLALAGLVVVGDTSHGEEAVSLCVHQQPDIVLLDVGLPDISGYEAARRILLVCSPCIVFLSGFSDNEHIEQAWQAGGFAYLAKPIMRDTLLPRLEKAYSSFPQVMAVHTLGAYRQSQCR